MKKTLFTPRGLFLATMLAGFIACEEPNLSPEESNAGVVEASKENRKLSARPVIDGKALNLAYGFDIATNSAKSVALDENSYSVISNQPIASPVQAVFQSIETKEQLETFVSGGVSIKGSGTVKMVNLGGGLDVNFTNNININKNTINVLVKLSYANNRYTINGTPSLNADAKRTLRYNFGRFNEKYGLFYVGDNTIGGEVLYLYTYDYSSVSKYSRGEVKAAINASIVSLFNINGETQLTAKQKQITEKSFTYSKQYSKVKGFNPSTIKTLSDFEREKNKLSQFVDNPSNSDNLISINKTLVSYGDITSYEEFNFQRLKLLRGQKSYGKWNKLSEKIKVVYFNSSDPYLVRKSEQALRDISSNLSKLRRFIEVQEPTEETYADILNQFHNTIDPKFLGVPVHIYPQGGVLTNRKYLSCTPDGTSVHLWTHDEKSGRQQWIIRRNITSRGKQYYTLYPYGGLSGYRKYLSVTSNGYIANLAIHDDSNREKWGFKLLNIDNNSYQIYIKGGISNNRKLLSCTPLGINIVGLWSRDDENGRQKWIVKLAEK